MNNSTCYIIIVNYNSYENVVKCVESIFFSSYTDYKIIIVDNFSTDDSLRLLQNYFQKEKKIIILKSNDNNGYGSGNNIGINKALKSGDCEYLWILNNDTIVFSDTLEELILSSVNSDNYAIYGSKVLNVNGSIQSVGCILNGTFMTTSHNFENRKDQEIEFIIDDIDYIHGCSIFFHNKIISINGLLSEEYFLFYEDVDYSIRAKKNNIPLIISQKSKVIHKGGSSIKKYRLDYLSTLNRIKFSKKFFPEKIPLVYLGVIYEILKSILLFRINKSFQIIRGLIN